MGPTPGEEPVTSSMQDGELTDWWLILNLTSVRDNITNDTLQDEIPYLTDQEIYEHFRKMNQKYDSVTQSAIIASFLVLMLIGAFGNSLVCWVVISNPKMRTKRNIFVVNLAISDLTLCVFTQLFNLYKVVHTEWSLGEGMCKFVSMFSATNVFVSTASITAIALDRFRVIVYSTHQSQADTGRLHSCIYLVMIWVVSLLMATPLAVFSTIQQEHVTSSLVLEYCLENEHMVTQRKFYSIALLVIQYILPIVIVCVAHARISRRLRRRMVTSSSLPPTSLRSQSEPSMLTSLRHSTPPQQQQKSGCFGRSSRQNKEDSSFKLVRNSVSKKEEATYQSLLKRESCSEKVARVTEDISDDPTVLPEPCPVPPRPSPVSPSAPDPQADRPFNGSSKRRSRLLSRVSALRLNSECQASQDQEDAQSTNGLNATVIFLANKRRREARRKRKTNTLLVLIAVIFAASWIPLNLANILVDFREDVIASFEEKINSLLFPICHLIVLCSACINPLLYGWLNDNFRREFTRVLSCTYIVRSLAPRFKCCRRCARSADSASSQRSSAPQIIPADEAPRGCCPRGCAESERKRRDEELNLRSGAYITSCPSATFELTSRRSTPI